MRSQLKHKVPQTLKLLCVCFTHRHKTSVRTSAHQQETVRQGAKTKVSTGKCICLGQSKAVSWGRSSVSKSPGAHGSPARCRVGHRAAGLGSCTHTHPILHASTTRSLPWPTGVHQTMLPHHQPVPCHDHMLQLSQASQNPASHLLPPYLCAQACLCLECLLLPLPPQWPNILLLIWVHSRPN